MRTTKSNTRSLRTMLRNAFRAARHGAVLPKTSTSAHTQANTLSDRQAGAPAMSHNGVPSTVRPFTGFSESTYLDQNPDIAATVRRGLCRSGWCHFIQQGYLEDRPGVTPEVMQTVTAILAPSGKDKLPPAFLRKRVHGSTQPARFIEVGAQVAHRLAEEIHAMRIDLPAASRILDFGCGCGRVLRHLQQQFTQYRFYGTDIDGEAILWCQTHLQVPGEFVQNRHRPPAAFAENMFDIVYAVSVFTHLPEDRQLEWLQELWRVTRPGGFLLLTVRSPAHLEQIPREEPKKQLRDYGFAYAVMGTVAGLPNYYRTAWHSHEYIERTWSRWFEICKIIPQGAAARQDFVICRKAG